MKSQGICNPYFLAQGRRFAPSLEVHQVGEDISVDRLIACCCSLVPSLRTNDRLACGPHGAHPFEIPGAEPPSDRSARLRPSWSTPERESRRRAPERLVGLLAALMEHAGRGILVSSPRAIGRLACG